MKKLSLYKNLIITMMIVLFLIPFKNVSAEQKDFSSNHTFANETLEELIEVHAYDKNYDQSTAQEMIDRIAVFPEIILKETLKQDVKLLLIDFPLTDLDEFEDLQGVVPRGWEHTDATWDDVPGAGGQTSVARIGFSEPGNGHGSINLEFHEFSHAIDHYMLSYSISETSEFIQIHEEEKSKMWPDGTFNTDYMDHVEEYFAETSALYYLGGDHKNNLKNVAPKTYDYIKNLPKRILSIENGDSTGVSLSWENINEADEYYIYRDSNMIGTTDEPYFIDNSFEEYTLHSYQVQAIDSSGAVINETFVNGIMTSDLSIPEAPLNIIGTLTDDFTISLEWDEVTIASAYDILRDDEIITTVEDTYFIDEMIEDNKQYHYSVQAKNSAGISPISSTVVIDTFINDEEQSNIEVGSEQEQENSIELINKPINWIYFILIGGVIFISGLLLIGIILFFVLRRRRESKSNST